MTAKPYPHAVQKAARRGVLSAAGSKRVEVVLDAEEQSALHWFRYARGLNSTSEAIKALIKPHIPKPGESLF